MKKVTYVSIALVVVLVLLAFLLMTSNKKAIFANSERFYATATATSVDSGSVASMAPANPDAASAGIGSYMPADSNMGMADTSASVGGAGPSAAAAGASCFPRDRLTAEQLLPKDAANSQWAKVNPAGQGDVSDQNFLSAGHHVGLLTTNSKNPNLSIRSEPLNPRMNVSPWMQSTINPDNLRRGVELNA